MSFPYYERIVKLIKEGKLKEIEYANFAKDSKGELREVYYILHFSDGYKANIYKGKAKSTRLLAVFNAIDEYHKNN